MEMKRNLLKQQGQKGEIITVMTIAALILMGAGLAIGVKMGLNKKPQTTAASAQSSCSYKAFVHVYKNEEGTFFTSTEIGALRATNDRGATDPSQGLNLNLEGATKNQYIVDNFKFDPTRQKNYAENDPATVRLSGIGPKWRVKKVFCINRGTPGCPDAAEIAQMNAALDGRRTNGLEIKGFRVNCGVDITYGWILGPADTMPTDGGGGAPGGGGNGGGGGPTVAPTQVPNPPIAGCSYTSTALVLKKAGSENVNIPVSSLTGGPFTATREGGTPLNLDEGGYSQRGYHTDAMLESQVRDRTNGDAAKVTLGNLNRDLWKVTQVFCNQKDGSVRGCPTQSDIDRMNAGIVAGSSDGTTIDEFRVNCGVDLTYGWIVEDKNSGGGGNGGGGGGGGGEQPNPPTATPTPGGGNGGGGGGGGGTPPTPVPPGNENYTLTINVKNENPNVRTLNVVLDPCPELRWDVCFKTITFNGEQVTKSTTIRSGVDRPHTAMIRLITAMDGADIGAPGSTVIERLLEFLNPAKAVFAQQNGKAFITYCRGRRYKDGPDDEKCLVHAPDHVDFRIVTQNVPNPNPVPLGLGEVSIDGIPMKDVSAKDLYADSVDFVNTPTEKMTFHSRTNEFTIQLANPSDEGARMQAEQSIMRELDISRNEACKLKIGFEGGARGLSFCGSPYQEDLTGDGLVRFDDFSQCIFDATSDEEDLLCDFNVNRRIDASDIERILDNISPISPR